MKTDIFVSLYNLCFAVTSFTETFSFAVTVNMDNREVCVLS